MGNVLIDVDLKVPDGRFKDEKCHSIRSASIGFKFAASLAGRYPNSTPTPLETTSATTTAIQEIPSGTMLQSTAGPTRRVQRSHYSATAPAKLMKNASNRNWTRISAVVRPGPSGVQSRGFAGRH